MNEELLRPGERIDDLQRNGYRIIQDPRRFCFGMDAVVLSGFAAVRPGEAVLDLCTGTGILPILLAAKTKASHLTGLELQEESADMARRSLALNGLEDRIDIVTGDACRASAYFGKGSYPVITVNPPYMKADQGLPNQAREKTIARHEVCFDLPSMFGECGKILPHHGRLYMVHRPFRLTELFVGMAAAGIEPKRLRMVHPRVSDPPAMVLIEGLRGGKSGLRVDRPLILYDAPGVYSREVKEDYGF